MKKILIITLFLFSVFLIPENLSAESMDNFATNIDMGKIAYSENKPLQAIYYFSKAQNIKPNELVSYIELGKIYFEQDEFSAAIEQLEKGKKIRGLDLKHSEFAVRIQQLKDRVNIDDQYPKKSQFVNLLEELNGYEKSVYLEDLELLRWLSLAYQSAKNESKAIETMKSVLEIDPANDGIRIKLGKIYLAQGKYEKASEQLELVSESKDLAYEKNVMLAFCYGALAQISKMRLIVSAHSRVFAIVLATVCLLCLVSLGLIGALFITAFLIGKKTRHKAEKYKNIHWSLHQAFFVCIGLFTLPLCLEILLGRIVYNNWILFLSPAKDIQASAGQNALLSQLVTVIFICIAVFWLALKQNGQSLRDLGFRWIKIRKFALLAMKAILMIFLFNIVYTVLFSAISGGQPEQQYIAEIISKTGKSWNLIFLFFFAVIIGPFAEEIIFRGFIYSGLRKHCSFMTAAIISACIFGIFHLQETLFIPLAFMGFILALTFERTRSLLPAVVVHMLWNFIVFMNLIFLS